MSPRLSPAGGLTVAEVAERLGHPRSVVYALCEAGVLPHARVSNAIRVAPADLEAYVQARRSGGRP